MARTLGLGRWQAFRRVTWPLTRGRILSGALLAFGRAWGEFGATLLIAGNIPGRTQTVALALFERVQAGEEPGALRLFAVAAAVAFAAVGGSELLRRRRAPA
jgi:molybdate transport system permease protein